MKLNVQIIDDDQVIIFLHKVIIKKSGLSADPAIFSNGQQALNSLLQNFQQGERYLIFLDINMPVMDGWQFLDEIQKLPFEKSIMVVMVTSSIDASDKIKAKVYSQVIDFIEKPLKFDACNKLIQLPEIAHFL